MKEVLGTWAKLENISLVYLKAIDEGLTEELDKSIKKPIEIVNLIFNYYVGDGGAEFVSGSEHVIKEVMLCARYTSHCH